MGAPHHKKDSIKKTNLDFHADEAELFDQIHVEIFSNYEIEKSRNNIEFIKMSLGKSNLCVDIGCGTGFLTALELGSFESIVATDISSKMIEKTRQKMPNSKKLNFLVCDAENSPFKNEVFDLVSISSVLHHLPSPLSALLEANRILRENGFIYITREPNDARYSKLADFLHRTLHFVFYNSKKKSQTKTTSANLNSSEVDIHYPTGFNVNSLSNFLCSKRFNVVRASSYHWVFSATTSSFTKNVLSKVNCLIERVPFSWKFGRSIFIIAKKIEQPRTAPLNCENRI